ncbi:MAG: GLPGLI family protein [Flavobacteriaceae bacterium]|jgi:GLPGLI family protein|nr:GLPGLI family protein [Flavobacteriaceae bacterium]MCB0485384.1 GLPGLI family protein [Flavobacteriaceae bacterium]
MKKILSLLVMVSFMTANAQNFQGKATYKTHRKMDLQISGDKNAPNEEMQKQIQEQLRKQFQRTYFLNFTQTESTYKQEEQLSSPQPQAAGVAVQIVSAGSGQDVLYKNLKENRYVNKAEIMGKRFLIKDTIAKQDWQLTGETKSIGKYTCYKATYSREINYKDISAVDGEVKEEEKTRTVVTTAWYTPEIPVSNGPSNYGGLPGLILEINEDKLTIVCSEIVMNPDNKITIEEPTKGKEVSQKEYDEIMDKKQQEMIERMRNNRPSKDGNTIEIKIGG